MKKLVLFFGTMLFFLMIFIPQSFSFIKIIVLLITLLFYFIVFGDKKLIFSLKFLYWFLFYFLFYSIWILYGLFFNNPGITDTARLELIWPIIYIILLSIIESEEIITKLYKFFIITSFFISFYNLYKFIEIIFPVPKLFLLDQNFEIGIHDGYVQIVSLNIGSLVFLMPLLFSIFIIGEKFYNKIKINKYIFLLILILVVFTSVISGRRALWFSIFLTIALMKYFTSFYSNLKNTNFDKNVFKLFFALFLFGTVYLSSKINIDDFKNKFTEEFNTENQTVRQEQSKALIAGFYNNPLLGTGFGKGVNSVVRNIEKPWTYELTYHVILYNTGIIGFIFFIALILYPIYWSITLIKKTKDILILPILCSYIIILLNSTSNPFFTSSFDFQWMLFLPIGILNRLELNFKKSILNQND